jgi:CRISPR-associated protein Cmr6
MSAAQPAYLKDTSDAAPGHHFGLYYAGWNPDFSKPKAGASDILRSTVCKLPSHSRNLLTALTVRQNAEALTLAAQIFTYPAIATAPFATGLGNEHPLENGFSFLSPYGLPYLPGSSVKGVIRKAAEELLSGDWDDDTQGWSADAIRALFGPGEEDDARDSNPLQGALRFWDVIPTPPAAIKNDKALLTVEIMTPHHSGYYQDGKTPNTSESPTPISFLAVAAEAHFTFHVECNPARINPELQANWRQLLEAAFTHAGKWLGFGAKTAVGYGRMALDKKAKETADDKAAEQARNSRLAAMTEARRDIEAFCSDGQKRAEQLNGGKDKPNTAYHAKASQLAKKALESTTWTPEEKIAAADAIEQWLPKVVAVDAKEFRKKLNLTALRTP